MERQILGIIAIAAMGFSPVTHSATHAAIVLTAAGASPTRVHMGWNVSGSGNKYEIYRDGVLHGTTHTNTAADTGLKPGTEYCYKVEAASGSDTGSSNKSCATTAALAGWNIERVGAAPPLSLALDAQSREHLGFCTRSGVVYAIGQASGSWKETLVDPTASCFAASLAIGGDGSAHMVYLDYVSNTVKYASNVSGRWKVGAIPGTEGALFPVFALDSGDHVHLAYLSFTGQLPEAYQIVYVTNASGAWRSTVVATDFGYPVISVNAQAQPSIAYIGIAGDTSYPVHYLHKPNRHWVDSVVATSYDAKSLVALALDANGAAHLLYKDQASLEYVTNAGGSWVTMLLDSFDTTGPFNDSYGAYDVSVEVGSHNRVHASYLDTDGNLKYVAQTSTAWSSVYVDTEGTQNQLKVDSAGHAHIAYANSQNLYSNIATEP